MADILDEVLQQIPNSKSAISDATFEGANIILYTKDKEFFLNQSSIIRDIVNNIKKRIELRPDPSLCMELEAAQESIKKIVPSDAGLVDLKFDPQRSIVILEAEKPGIAIGKQGDVLKEIRRQTLWVPTVVRSPPLKSQIIENIRSVLFMNNDYRKKFLNKVGHRIYDGWKHGERKGDWVRLTMLGGGRQVGRSCIFIQTTESRVLLDCGIDVSASTDQNAYPILDCPEFKIEELDAIILSHSHMDHSGAIPFLYRMGYRGPVYCTAPTRDVAALLALDYIGVTFKQAKKMPFDIDDVKEMVKHTITLDWEEVTDITPDIRLTLYNSGHVLGSSMCHLHIGNGLHNFLYTADFKFIRTRTLEPAATNFPRLETVLIESTYGGKDDVLTSRKDAEAELFRIVKMTVERGGKILIPVLGVGRAQEIMLLVAEAIKQGLIPEFPVYVQGMVWDVTAIHTAYPDYLNINLKKEIFHKDQNPFLSKIFTKITSKKEQDKIIEETGPCIIIATAGMLNAGASLEYFKRLADNPKNTILFVTYQGEGTIGRRVQRGEKEIQFNGGDRPEIINVKMEVRSVTALSGHAGRTELLNFIQSLNPKPKRIITNHGESSKCVDLASSLHKMAHIETSAPKNLETIRLR